MNSDKYFFKLLAFNINEITEIDSHTHKKINFLQPHQVLEVLVESQSYFSNDYIKCFRKKNYSLQKSSLSILQNSTLLLLKYWVFIQKDTVHND